jgi:hypothetical protein
MSDEKNAIILWTLERFYEETACQFLVKLSTNEEGFIAKVNKFKNEIMARPPGSWMFDKRSKELIRDVKEMDIGELCVLIKFTDLKENEELTEEMKKSFHYVKDVRNRLAHRGQQFGVDEADYNQKLGMMRKCLKDLGVSDYDINHLVNQTLSPTEKKKIIADQRQKAHDLKVQILEQLTLSFIEFEDFSLEPYIGEMIDRKVVTRAERAIIEKQAVPRNQNVEFRQFAKGKTLDALLTFIEIVRPSYPAFAESFELFT